MLTIEEIRKRLYDRQLVKVAKATGLSVQTLWRIRQDPKINVRYDTLAKLNRYFEENL